MKRRVELLTSGWDESAVLDVIGKKDRAAKLAAEAMLGDDIQIVAGPRVQASSMIGYDARRALRRRGTAMPTVMPLAMSTSMRTTFPMSGDDARSSLRRRGTMMSTSMPTTMSTEMKTSFPMSGDDPRRALRRRGTMMSTVMPLAMPTTMRTTFPMSGDVELADDAKKVLAVGILGAGAYGVYKLAGGGDGKPWIHRLNPLYWFKSENEKKFVDAEKSRGVRNVELDKELVAAQKAYNVSQAAETKEKQLAAIQAGVKVQGDIIVNRGGLPASLDPNNLPFVNYPGQWLHPDGKRDQKILNAIRGADGGKMIKKGARLDYGQSKSLYEIINNFFESNPNTTTGPAPYNTPFMATEAWMAEFIEKNGVRYTDHDGKVYVMKNKIRRLAIPTSEAQMNRDSSVVLGDGTPTKTLVGPALPGMNVQLDKILLAALTKAGIPIGQGAVWTNAQANAAAKIVKGSMAQHPDADKWFAGFIQKQSIFWKDSSGSTKGLKGDQIYNAAYQPGTMPVDAPPDVHMRTSKGARSTADIMGLATEAPTNIPPEVKIYLAKSVATQSKRISEIAGKENLINKKAWTEDDRDKVAVELLKQMMQGKVANPSDVRMAREITILWAKGAGHTVPDMIPATPASVSGDFVGDWWNPFSWSPVQWAGKQIAKPFVWAGQQLGIVKKPEPPKTPQQARLQAYAAAARSRAAAKARILAAEKKHEAAVAERAEQAKIANMEARAAEAEAAANEAERIAITAEAEKGLRGYADAVEGAVAAAGQVSNAPAVALADPRAKAVSLRSLANALKNNVISYGWIEKPINRPRLLKFGAEMGWWQNPVQFGTPPWIERLSNLTPPKLIAFKMAGMGAAVAPAPSDANIDAKIDSILNISAGPLAVSPIITADKSLLYEANLGRVLVPLFKGDVDKARSYFAGYAERRGLTVYKNENGRDVAYIYRGGMRVPASKVPGSGVLASVQGDAAGDASKKRAKHHGNFRRLVQTLKRAGVPVAQGARWDTTTYYKAQDTAKKVLRAHGGKVLGLVVKRLGITVQQADGKWYKQGAVVSGAELMGRGDFVGWSLPKLISFSQEA